MTIFHYRLRSTELLILDELHKMPFSISELQEDKLSNDIERFIQRGGLPEPFLAEDEVEANDGGISISMVLSGRIFLIWKGFMTSEQYKWFLSFSGEE